MAIWVLLFIPFFTSVVAYALPGRLSAQKIYPFLLPLCGLLHLCFTLRAVSLPSAGVWNRIIALDALGKPVLLVVSILFFCCFLYAPQYLLRRRDHNNRVFCTCLALLLMTITLVILAQHFALLWVALEGSTLCAAPLLYFNQTPRALETVWKYMLICSVGIALALLGTFFLAYSSLHSAPSGSDLVATLSFPELIHAAPTLSQPWLLAAFVTLVIGYGTKMGIAPMHTWKPDAYGEAPGVVGALLAGGVTSGAFVAMARVVSITQRAGVFEFASRMLITLGLLSMAIAAIFMIGQRDFKRLLAYSSVEHMGILILGLGLGDLGFLAALFHLASNALTKGVLFLAAGNIHHAFGSKVVDEVRAAFVSCPLSAWLFMTGFIAITGSPPFAPFFSEFTLLRAAFMGGHYVIGGLFVFLLLSIFMGMGSTVLAVTQGVPQSTAGVREHQEGFFAVLPIFILLGLVTTLGLCMPESYWTLLENAGHFIEEGK